MGNRVPAVRGGWESSVPRFAAPNHAIAKLATVFSGESAAPVAGAVATIAPRTLGTTTVRPQTLKKAVSKVSTPAASALACVAWMERKSNIGWLDLRRRGKRAPLRATQGKPCA